MRTIDADALKDALFQKHVHDGEELEPMLYLDDAMKVVDEAPTVDAIPMWWITEKYLDVLNKDKELSKAVWLVRKAWIEEQEATR